MNVGYCQYAYYEIGLLEKVFFGYYFSLVSCSMADARDCLLLDILYNIVGDDMCSWNVPLF